MKAGLSDKICFALTTFLIVAASSAYGADLEDSQTIGLFSDEKPEVATSPIPRPTSKVAENITVITADEIQRLNAHTITEILQTVPGIQLEQNQRTPTTFTFFNIQGALNTTVLVFVDGIRQNDFDQDIANPSLIPVQQIERIEIIKGASSGSWGSALGGVINIVTKSPNPERAAAGMVSSSIGSRFTSDSRAEVSGTKDRFGYYLTAGHLRSDGLTPNTDTSLENLYGKFTYHLPAEGVATLGLSHIAAWPGVDQGEIPGRGYVHDDSQNSHSYGFLKVQQPLAERLGLEILGYATGRDDRETFGRHDAAGNDVVVNTAAIRDNTRGVNANLSWGDSRDNLVAGGEYAHVHGKALFLMGGEPPIYDRSWDRYAGYLNGSYSLGDLSILPGVRYDATGLWGNFTSYTLGATYQLGEQTTLRAYAARGFSIPMLEETGVGIEKVNTLQAGVESGRVPFLWLKGTYFYNTARANISLNPSTTVVTDQQRQGVELEARTLPCQGISVAAGYTFLHAENGTTYIQQTLPPHVYKLALYYDNPGLGLRGAMTGSGVVWRSTDGPYESSRGMVWDLNLTWRGKQAGALTPELFFSAHNLFNAVQTTSTVLYTNAMRWYEGGARFWF